MDDCINNQRYNFCDLWDYGNDMPVSRKSFDDKLISRGLGDHAIHDLYKFMYGWGKVNDAFKQNTY